MGACVALVLCALPLTAGAQGAGPPIVPPGLGRRPSPPQPAPTPPLADPAAAAQGVDAGPGAGATHTRSLGVWLDDATALQRGEVWASVSFLRWASPSASGVQRPAFSVAAGASPIVNLGVTVPYTTWSVGGEEVARGFGDLYVSSKIVVRDAAVAGGWGLSFGPTLELLARTTSEALGRRRVQAVLPVSLERRLGVDSRLYGSTGYFTRGVWFGSGAVEHAFDDRWIGMGSVSLSRSIDSNALSEEIGLRRTRVDATGAVAFVAAPSVVLYGSLTRTLSALDADAVRYAIGVGASVGVSGRK